jgi:nicotinate-nucleotide--dimethylbenzimidazole phosphoribosyltransferase
MSADSLLIETLDNIRAVDPQWIEAARQRQLQLTKPPGSLGRLEEVSNRLAGIQATLAPSVARARIAIFAADHGVCAEGVNPYPQAVTAQMVANFLRGGAAINALAGAAGAELQIVDAGVAHDIPCASVNSSLIRRAIGLGTKNFCVTPAMTHDQAVASLSLGIELAYQAAAEGYTLLAIGEMGIGSTTAASAVTAALTGIAPSEVTGRGTGADESCMARKRSAIQRALALHQPNIQEPLDILTCLGGLEIGAMTGFCLGAAASRCAVLVDGFIATAAAALAVRMNSAAADYLIPAHRSTEPGHPALLAIIGHRPLLDLEMRLGEGTGAALAIPIVRAAVAAFIGMATFADAGVAEAGGEGS